MTAAVQAPWSLVVVAIEVLLFSYFLVCNLFYVFTALVAVARLPGFVKLRAVDRVPRTYSELDPPVSVVVPAYNEAELIAGSVRSLLALEYSTYEVIVVNDGSTDETLAVLVEEFELEPYPGVYRVAIPTGEVRGIYRSLLHPNLMVLDKLHAGKADALNAGINLSQYPLVFAGDADSYYERSALRLMVEPIQKDPTTLGVGSAIAVANDCTRESPTAPLTPRLPSGLIERFQVLEYLRSFLATRMGWAPFNALTIVSGASGLWRRDVLVEVGGYRKDTIWEDMELTMRIHNTMRSRKVPYRVAFTPYPVCWTNVPASIGALYRQRRGWHRHLSECMTIHRGLFWRGGVVGWATMPFLLLFEWLAPVFVAFGILFTVAGLVFGFLNWFDQVVLVALVLILAILISLISVILDQVSYNVYQEGINWTLFSAVVLENFGYRQLNWLAGLAGIVSWVRRTPLHEDRMRPPGAFVRAYRPR